MAKHAYFSSLVQWQVPGAEPYLVACQVLCLPDQVCMTRPMLMPEPQQAIEFTAHILDVSNCPMSLSIVQVLPIQVLPGQLLYE
jgi:hypothetical protein